MKELLAFIEKHGTKVIGWLVTVAGAIALMDKDLVLRTLGPNAADWALLIAGAITVARGHQNTATEKARAAAANTPNQPKE